MTTHIQTLTDSYRENALRRLRRVEGQLRGIQKMIEEGRYCVDILTQITAAQEGLRGTSKVVLRNYLENCATQAIQSGDQPEIYDELMEVVYRYVR